MWRFSWDDLSILKQCWHNVHLGRFRECFISTIIDCVSSQHASHQSFENLRKHEVWKSAKTQIRKYHPNRISPVAPPPPTEACVPRDDIASVFFWRDPLWDGIPSVSWLIEHHHPPVSMPKRKRKKKHEPYVPHKKQKTWKGSLPNWKKLQAHKWLQHEKDQDHETFENAKNQELAAKLITWMKEDSKWKGEYAQDTCSKWIKKWKSGNTKSVTELKIFWMFIKYHIRINDSLEFGNYKLILCSPIFSDTTKNCWPDRIR